MHVAVLSHVCAPGHLGQFRVRDKWARCVAFAQFHSFMLMFLLWLSIYGQ